MATERHGRASFPGVQQILHASYSLNHGITPGRIVIDCAPQGGDISTVGTFEISDGVTSLKFTDCRIDNASLSINGSGQIVSLSLLDRRWRWAFGQISGRYNVRTADGSIDPATKMEPQKLAKLCTDAMGEQRVDVRDMPNDQRPAVEWDYDNPAAMLAELAEQVGCRVVLRLDGTVAIKRLGSGATLPLTPAVLSDSRVIDPPEKPSKIVCVCEQIFQCDFELEAVIFDPADRQYKLPTEITWRPSTTESDGGWSKVDLVNFHSITDVTLRDVAREHAFRSYRIKKPATLPGFGTVSDLKQLLPLLDRQAETEKDDDNREVALPPMAYGIWYSTDRTDSATNQVTSMLPLGRDSDTAEKDPMLVTVGFSIDRERGIIRFSQPVFKYTSVVVDGITSYKREFATLRLRIAVMVRDDKTRAAKRYERERAQRDSRASTKPRYIFAPDVLRRVIPVYTPQMAPNMLDDNKAEANKGCDHYLDAAEREYELTAPHNVSYAGIMKIDPDGAIHRVAWEVGGEGAVTTAQRNNDTDPIRASYRELRFLERLKADMEDTVVGDHRAEIAAPQPAGGQAAQA